MDAGGALAAGDFWCAHYRLGRPGTPQAARLARGPDWCGSFLAVIGPTVLPVFLAHVGRRRMRIALTARPPVKGCAAATRQFFNSSRPCSRGAPLTVGSDLCACRLAAGCVSSAGFHRRLAVCPYRGPAAKLRPCCVPREAQRHGIRFKSPIMRTARLV